MTSFPGEPNYLLVRPVNTSDGVLLSSAELTSLQGRPLQLLPLQPPDKPGGLYRAGPFTPPSDLFRVKVSQQLPCEHVHNTRITDTDNTEYRYGNTNVNLAIQQYSPIVPSPLLPVALAVVRYMIPAPQVHGEDGEGSLLQRETSAVSAVKIGSYYHR